MEILEQIAGVLIVLTTVLMCYQFFYLFIPVLFRRKLPKATKNLRYAVLIAARNEELVIPHLLESIHNQDYPTDLIDIYVVADNCTDNTAAVAEAHGATVFQRFNKQFVGKGYALQYLLQQIQLRKGWESYDAFMIFDADNLLAPNYFSQINVMPNAGFEAFCGYRNTKNYGDNWITSGYGLWYMHESTHMNRSRMVLGSGCAVNGTGFGFTSRLLEQLGGWNFFTLTEDLEFNNWCAIHNVKIGYCHSAMVYDEQPLAFSQSWKQRTRWAQGGFQVSIKYGTKLLRNLFSGGWRTYTSAELFTLSFWGYALMVLTGLVTSICTFGQLAPVHWPVALLVALGGSYGGMFLMGLWTLILEWKNICASTWQKIFSVFTFPLFMMTYIPIGLTALLRKFQWEPIAHTVAISSKELAEKK